MPSGGKLAIEAENASFRGSGAAPLPELAAGDYVRVRVADTGTGIPRENIDKVIEPFFTTKGPGAGTGLGLSMVYGFVKQSNGDLAIDSEVGRGTTIDLYFPRATDEVHEPLPVVEHNHRGVETVLLVEDFDRFRERAAALLTELGYKVIAAGNGDEALSILNDGTAVDLLLTDLVMPGGLGGRQLAVAARDLRSDIKVLFMSGYEDRTTNSNGGAGDSAPQLRKPFSKGDLADAVRDALDGDG
jgi:CheY-like chemotaxis protein